MRVFVLGGGGNLGPLQVGALKALLLRNIYPDAIIGCSVGALNAIALAKNVSLESIQELIQIWDSVNRRDIYPGNTLNRVWRILTNQDSLHDNRNLVTFLQKHGLHPTLTFGDVAKIPLYITTTHFDSGRLRVFGHSENDRILDATMATTAAPPMHAPWEINGERYIDGSTITPLPLRIALEIGATEIYALRIEHFHELDTGENKKEISGTAGVLHSTISTMMRQHVDYDLALVKARKDVVLHQMLLKAPKSFPRNDFGHSERLINIGYQSADAYLSHGSIATDLLQPITLSLWQQSRELFGKLIRKVSARKVPMMAR
ncbi:patatin-like phospholipase family protein [Chloroflexi bacterium TSY]|nr:patatin-like phospholipase family protein [Chloroflexi bacterium TSY]